MSDLARVEGDEIVVRVPIALLKSGALHSGVSVTDECVFAKEVALQLNAEGADEDLYLNKVIDAAIVRSVEAGALGADFIEE